MLPPIKVVDIELSHPLVNLEGLEGYRGVHGLVRSQGVPIGYVQAPITAGGCSADTLSKLILEQHSSKILDCLLENAIAAGANLEELSLEDFFKLPSPEFKGATPTVTVAICSRDRPLDLNLCLEAISRLNYPHLDILVVDNAPSSDATKNLVSANYPNVRYTCEPKVGLSWARNRAIAEAKGEIVAFTDDDVIVDGDWINAIAQVFAQNPAVMAVTGLVAPYELETQAQIFFEQHGGFGRGFDRQWYHFSPPARIPKYYLQTWRIGTGANMAYRRSIFDAIGTFNPLLGAGTPTQGAEDLEMFFRVLKAGYPIVYEPKALVKHRHRPDLEKLRSQLTSNGAQLAYFACSVRSHPDEFLPFLLVGLGLLKSQLYRLVISYIRPSRFPRDLIWAELWGHITALTKLQQSRQAIAEQSEFTLLKPSSIEVRNSPAIAVRLIELQKPLEAIADVTNYAKTRIFITWNSSPLGKVEIPNQYQPISTQRLQEAIVKALGIKLLEPNLNLSTEVKQAKAIAALYNHYAAKEAEKIPNRALSLSVKSLQKLPDRIPVSIIVPTCDRPDNLRNCLCGLTAQKTTRSLEIIVVDNRPASNITPPIVAEFPQARSICESRPGAAYARNAGILASSTEIIVTIDDDVTVPNDWLEKLIAPLARPT